jgi:hypothetical protein
MDTALILADQILVVIRSAGVSKTEAHAALSVVQAVLPSVNDISFRVEPGEDLTVAPDA